jgi:hypothetical protein
MKRFFLILLLVPVAVFAQAQDDYVFWRLLRSGRNVQGGVTDISHRDGVTVSLLLPLEDGRGGLDRRFGEFYRGALLALDELAEQGVNVRARLFDTPRDADSVAAILDSEEFAGTDLVIGPVYAEGMERVLEWGRRSGVPVVSPLTVMDGFGGEVFYQMAPTPATKYDKLTAMLTRAGTNVVYVRTAQPDAEMDSQLLPLLGNATQIVYGSMALPFDSRAAENIFVVSCTEQNLVDRILGELSSIYSDLRARSATSSELRVVGSAPWARFSGSVVDRELYFKTGVCYVTNYHADRTDAHVRAFDGRYIARFGDVPPSAPLAAGGRDNRVLPYAYRGYDAVKLFVGATMTRGYDFTSKLNAEGHELLQVPYHFEQSVWGDWQNTSWPLVTYHPDYTIAVE